MVPVEEGSCQSLPSLSQDLALIPLEGLGSCPWAPFAVQAAYN